MAEPAEQQDDFEDDSDQVADTPEMRAFIRDHIHAIKRLQDERKAFNEQITAHLSDLEAKGISRQGAKEALKRLRMTDEQRIERDSSYSLCVLALEIGEQPDLFMDQDDTPRGPRPV